MGGAERFAGGADKIAFQRFLWGERQRVQHQIKPTSLAAHFFKKCADFFVARNVARHQWRFLSKFSDQFLDVFLQSLALIIKNEARAGAGPRFSNRPRDAALVRHAENETDLPFQNLLSHR